MGLKKLTLVIHMSGPRIDRPGRGPKIELVTRSGGALQIVRAGAPAAPAAPPAPPPDPKPDPAPAPEPKPEPTPLPPPPPPPKPKAESPPPDADDSDSDEHLQLLDQSVKQPINMVFIGHVDAGKSTLCGRVLLAAGVVDSRTIEKYQREAQALGRESWYLSWVMDLADTERARGKTEELGVARFESESHSFTLLDAPGHRSFVPQMIGGAVQADVAVLVVSARSGEFEAGFDRGGQTMEHLLIAKTTGVRYIIIVINKMDDETVEWSRQRFEFIREKLVIYLLREIGYKREDFIFIPVAALSGGNISEPCAHLPWFQGPTLLAALDAVPQPPRNESDAFRMPIIDRYVSRASLYVSGKIEKGVISEGKAVVVMPSGVRGTVQGLFVEDAKIRTGVPGDNLRVMLRGVALCDCAAGSVLCLDGDPCNVAEKVIVKLRLATPGPDFITSGFLAMCHLHTDVVPVTFDRLLEVLKPNDEKNPKFVKGGQIVRVVLKFERPVCVETFASFPQLGRFLLRYEGATIGVGVVEMLPRAAAKS